MCSPSCQSSHKLQVWAATQTQRSPHNYQRVMALLCEVLPFSAAQANSLHDGHAEAQNWHGQDKVYKPPSPMSNMSQLADEYATQLMLHKSPPHFTFSMVRNFIFEISHFLYMSCSMEVVVRIAHFGDKHTLVSKEQCHASTRHISWRKNPQPQNTSFFCWFIINITYCEYLDFIQFSNFEECHLVHITSVLKEISLQFCFFLPIFHISLFNIPIIFFIGKQSAR